MTAIAVEAVPLRVCFKCGEPKVCADCHVPSDRCQGCQKASVVARKKR